MTGTQADCPGRCRQPGDASEDLEDNQARVVDEKRRSGVVRQHRTFLYACACRSPVGVPGVDDLAVIDSGPNRSPSP